MASIMFAILWQLTGHSATMESVFMLFGLMTIDMMVVIRLVDKMLPTCSKGGHKNDC